MAKNNQPQPCGNPNCPVCSGAVSFPQVLRVLIASMEEPQAWKVSPKGNIIPTWVEDEVKK